MNYLQLKEKQRALRHNFQEGLALRVHRALSWMNKAEQSTDDVDSQFIFLWVSFNAAYAQDIELINSSEIQSFSLFLDKLHHLDKDKKLYHILWHEFPSSIRTLLNNPYVYQPFWQYQNGLISQHEFEERFADAKRFANYALAHQESAKLTALVLQRLYTLRNQLIHGGATWNSSANREQLKDAVKFLSQLVPCIINIMMDNPNELWGKAFYPVINS